MIVVKATKESEAGVMPPERLLAEMDKYHEELQREEAMDWACRYPNPTIDGADTEIEVRQLFEMEDFEKGN